VGIPAHAKGWMCIRWRHSQAAMRTIDDAKCLLQQDPRAKHAARTLSIPDLKFSCLFCLVPYKKPVLVGQFTRSQQSPPRPAVLKSTLFLPAASRPSFTPAPSLATLHSGHVACVRGIKWAL
jgi:hypothetical protein